MSDQTIRLSSRVEPSPDALVQRTGDEAIVLDIASEKYFGLNEVGLRLWSLLTDDPSLARAHQQLLAEYDVEAPVLERDLIGIIGELAEAGLVRVD